MPNIDQPNVEQKEVEQNELSQINRSEKSEEEIKDEKNKYLGGLIKQIREHYNVPESYDPGVYKAGRDKDEFRVEETKEYCFVNALGSLSHASPNVLFYLNETGIEIREEVIDAFMYKKLKQILDLEKDKLSRFEMNEHLAHDLWGPYRLVLCEKGVPNAKKYIPLIKWSVRAMKNCGNILSALRIAKTMNMIKDVRNWEQEVERGKKRREEEKKEYNSREEMDVIFETANYEETIAECKKYFEKYYSKLDIKKIFAEEEERIFNELKKAAPYLDFLWKAEESK